MRTTLVGLAMMAAAAFIAGCPKTVNTVHIGEGGTDWIVTDPYLADRCRLLNARQVMEGDMLRVQVDVANTRSDEQDFQYQFTFYDANGMKLHSPTEGWDRRSLPGGGSTHLEAVAPDPRAKSAKLEIIRPRH